MSVRISPKSGLLAAIAAFVVTTVNYAANPGTALVAETRASTTVLLDQAGAVVARDAAGNYVVVWSGNGSGDADGIYFKYYSFNGVGGAETLANGTTTGVQQNPAVAMDASGNFVIVWESPQNENPAGGGNGIWGRRFDATGTATGAEFQVNATTLNDQTRPAVAMSANGAFVAAWQSLNDATETGGTGQGIFAQRFPAGSTTGAGQFLVNTGTTANSQTDPAVAMEPDGDYVITWTSNQVTDGNEVFFKTYSASDAVVQTDTIANATPSGQQVAPSVAVDKDGNFVVAWESPQTESPAGSGTGVWARRFDASGAPLTDEFQVNQTTSGDQKAPSVTNDVTGRFTIAWQSAGSDIDVYVRRFEADGSDPTLNPGEARVNSTTTGSQTRPAVAADADGDFVVAWESDQDSLTNGLDVYARRYVGPEDVDLSITKTDSADPVMSNAAFSYTLTVTNNHAVSTATGISAVDSAFGSATGAPGTTPTTTGIRVTDTLPSGPNAVTYNGFAGTDWNCTNNAGTVTCEYSKAIPAGSSRSVTLNVTAPITTGSAELDNTATVAAAQYDSVVGNNTGQQETYACLAATRATLQFSAANYSSLDEAAGTRTITVTRSGGCAPATVNFATSAGAGATGATPGSDYSETSGTLLFGTGETSKTFPVTILPDTLDEAGEIVNLTLSSPDRADLGTQGTATLTIVDDDVAPSVTLTPATATISETGGAQVVTATLSTASGQAITIPLTFTGSTNSNRSATCGTAQPSADYSCSATSISIPKGSLSGTMTVSAIGDTRNEVNETVTVDMTCDATCSETGTQQSVITITDDDAVPTVSFTSSSTTAQESIGTINVTVSLTPPSGQAVTVPLSTGGTASGSGVDYDCDSDSVTGGNQCHGSTITFPADSSGSQTVSVTVADDTIDEDAELSDEVKPSETATFTLGSPTNATVGATGTHTLTINDNDITPAVNLSVNPASPSTFAENGGTATVTATLSPATASGLDVTVTVGYSGVAKHDATCGTAQTPVDYACAGTGTGTGTTIVIPKGSTSSTLTLTSAADALDEASESIVASITDVTNGINGTTTSATAVIADDAADVPPSVTLSLSGSPFTENAGVATVTATLSAASGQDVTVSLSFGGTATNATDYTRSATSIVIPGDGVTTTGSVTLTGVDDTADEPNESVVVDISAVTNGTETGTQQVVATINDDDDVPQVSFASAASSPPESGAVGTPGEQRLVVQLSRPSADDVTVPYTLGPGNADGADFSVPPSPLVILAGNTSADIVVTLNNDANDEDDQTVIVNLGTPVNATLIAPSSHTVTILDDDSPPAVNFSPATQSVGEGDSGNTAVSVSASVAVTSEKTISIPFTVGGTATAGTDHDAVSGTITISANASTGGAAFSVAGDTLDENDETVTLTMGVPTNATKGTADVHTVTITNDDTAPTATLGLTGSPMAENGGSATLTATLSGVSGRDVVIALSYGGSASASDYTAPASITVPAGSLSANASITAVNDTILESTESVVVDMSCGASCIEATPQQVTADIADNDAEPTVTLSLTGSPFPETGGSATVTATLSNPSAAGVTINLGFSGDAVENTDYTPSASSITISGDTATTGSITLNATTDAIDELNESVVVDITGVTGGSESGSQQVSATLTDDDTSTVSIAATASAVEGSNVSFTLSLDKPSDRSITVTYSTTGGTATSGTDFTAATNATAVIAANATSGSIDVATANDATDEANETFTVTISAANTGANTGALVSGSAATGTGTITDNDGPPTVSFAASQIVTEGTGAGTTAVTLTATLSAVSGQTVTVPFTLGAGTAAAADHTAAADSITINAGSLSGTYVFNVTRDTTDEDDETVIFNMGTPTNATAAAPTSHTVTITDDDAAPTVSFPAGQLVTEGSGAGTTTVTVTATLSAVSGRTVTVPFTVGGTATAADHDAVAGTITINAGSPSGAHVFTVTRDALSEPDETVVFTMGTPTNATAAAPTTHTVTIDDDDPGPTVNFNPTTAAVTEGAAVPTVTVTAQLTAISGQSVTVPYTVSGTATVGADHNSAFSGNIVIPAGAISASVSFGVLDDGADEPDETVLVTMGTPTNATAGAANVHTTTIVDNDVPPADDGGGAFDPRTLALLLLPLVARRRRGTLARR